MSTDFVRKISCNELLYADMGEVFHACDSHYILEIKKLKSEKKLEEAINAAASFNSGTNVKLVGKKYYNSDTKIILQKIEIKEENIYDNKLFRSGLDTSSTTIAAYLAKHKRKRYLIIKVAHYIMDGKGGIMFIENIFRSLRNEELIKYSNELSDRDFLKTLDYKKKIEPKFPNLTPIHSKRVSKYVMKRRVIILNCYTTAIVAKIAKIIADEFKENTVRFMIPTDIRRHDRSKKYCGNMVLPTLLTVDKNTDTIASLNGKMLMSLKNKDELNIKNTSYFFYDHLPKLIRQHFMKSFVGLANKTQKFSIGSVISYLGKVNVDELKCDTLEISDFIALPTAEPLGPFLFLITEHSGKTQIGLSYYKGQFTEKYIDKLCEKLKDLENAG